MLNGLCISGCSNEPNSSTDNGNVKLQVGSDAFSNGQTIPEKYTCSGEDVSPPLTWSPPPAGTKSIAVIVEDVDAPGGTFTHWLLYNLPRIETVLAENIAKVEILDDGRKQGVNDFGKIGYSGPCPPPGKLHRYYFKIFALDTPLNLPPGATAKDLLAAINHHVLGEGELMGTFGR